MLRIYHAQDQKFLDRFISNTMNDWAGWAFAQPDCGKVNFPAQFVIVTEPRIALATIQFLH
jgi:hypothetical protein